MDNKSKYQFHNLLYLLDLECPESEGIINEASSKNLFRSPYRWLVMTHSTQDTITASFYNSSILADSDLVVAARQDDFVNMVELHKASSNGPIQSTPRGYYNGSLMDVRPHRELYRRRRDVMGHTITMSNVIQDSNTTRYHLPREDGMEPENDSIPKICWMNVRLAFQMLNATPGYIFSYRWGYKVNGNWSGMIDDLYTGRADLGTNCVVSDTERLDVVSYTDRLAPFRVRFIFRQPPLPYVANIFSMPFSTSVWVAMSVCVAVSTLTLYLAAKWEGRDGKVATGLDGIGDAMLLAFSAIGQQGCVMEPKRASGRMVVFVVFTALMALYAAYSANIVVLLQAPSDSIRSLPQLAAAKITLAANDVDYNHFIFGLYKDPVRVSVYKRVDPEKGRKQFYSINEGVERIREGLFAFHSIVEPVYRRIEQTFLESEKCDLMEIDFMNSFDTFVPVRKDSPYLELLRVVFKQIRESGIQSVLAKRLQVPKPHCTSKMSSFSSVGLSDMRPVLIFMLYGVLLSVTIVGGEIVVFKL
ncbi:ionotropic receptor 75a-like [Anticarsia gemmatalis]|uniref:ionotropic receptor 75a-like n=1 Tax=Anticarsia gemmatalis TaxID=129554 RepID=UPI003F757333